MLYFLSSLQQTRKCTKELLMILQFSWNSIWNKWNTPNNIINNSKYQDRNQSPTVLHFPENSQTLSGPTEVHMLSPERDTPPDASGPRLSKQGVTEETVLFLFPGVTIC